AAWRSSARLQGVASFQVLATPTNGLLRSSSPRPIARRKARCGARSMPSVTSRLWRLSGLVVTIASLPLGSRAAAPGDRGAGPDYGRPRGITARGPLPGQCCLILPERYHRAHLGTPVMTRRAVAKGG